jgi:hypothetical protein
MKNYFINQLEDEITRSYSLKYVAENYAFALKLNDACLDPLIKQEDRKYIDRLMNTYLRGVN